MGKDSRIAFRTSEEFKARVKAAALKVKLDETALAEKSLEALVEYIEEHGGIWLPLRIVPVPIDVAKKSFEAAGEPTDVPVGGPSIPSPARYTRSEEKLFALNEAPPAESAAPSPRPSKRPRKSSPSL